MGVEALLRWRHPISGVIPPDVFIPIAEDNGTIVPIGRWVLQEACSQGAGWHRRGYPLNISVNASARQLERPEFIEEVRAALDDSGLKPANLTIEITETVLMRKPDHTARLLGELKGARRAHRGRRLRQRGTARSHTCASSRSTRSRSTGRS